MANRTSADRNFIKWHEISPPLNGGFQLKLSTGDRKDVNSVVITHEERS